jgi:hypothetical protein
MGEKKNVYRILVGKHVGKRPLRRPRRIWEDNIKINLRNRGFEDRLLMELVQDRI